MNNSNRILMIAGGTCDLEFAKDFLRDREFDHIIAIDGGVVTAWNLKVRADYLVGDFDSVSKEVLESYQAYVSDGGKEAIVRPYNPEKDYTDTHIAMELAISLMAKEVFLLGATGSRFDHMLGNLNVLKLAMESGVRAYLIDNHNKIYLTESDRMIKKREQYGKYVSLIPFGSSASVTLTGFKYPLDRYEMKLGETIGISNEITQDVGQIILEDGILIVVEARD